MVRCWLTVGVLFKVLFLVIDLRLRCCLHCSARIRGVFFCSWRATRRGVCSTRRAGGLSRAVYTRGVLKRGELNRSEGEGARGGGLHRRNGVSIQHVTKSSSEQRKKVMTYTCTATPDRAYSTPPPAQGKKHKTPLTTPVSSLHLHLPTTTTVPTPLTPLLTPNIRPRRRRHSASPNIAEPALGKRIREAPVREAVRVVAVRVRRKGV